MAGRLDTAARRAQLAAIPIFLSVNVRERGPLPKDVAEQQNRVNAICQQPNGMHLRMRRVSPKLHNLRQDGK